MIDRVNQKPFASLDMARKVSDPKLPDDLRRFFEANEGVGLESTPDRIVRLSKLSEAKQITWSDLHIVGRDEPPKGWETFRGIRIGNSSFFDEIVYVQSAPCCDSGAILAIGGDLSGPGGSGDAIVTCLVLAASFSSWIKHLAEMNWIEYGIVPGELDRLQVEQRNQVYAYYKALNPRIDWRHVEDEAK